jgi:hypothetical protein
MQNQSVKLQRYYGLRLISLIYKMLCVLTILFVMGALGYLSLAAVNSPLSDWFDFQIWLPQALGLVIGGGLTALTFYVLAQMIEVQLSINAKMNQVLSNAQDYEKNSKLLFEEMEKIRVIVQGQARVNRLQATPANQPAPSVQQTTSTATPNPKAT